MRFPHFLLGWAVTYAAGVTGGIAVCDLVLHLRLSAWLYLLCVLVVIALMAADRLTEDY